MSEVTAVPLRPVGKSGVVALWAGIALLLVGGVAGAFWSTDAAVNAAMPPEVFLAKNSKRSGVVTTPSGLEYKVIEPGAGAKPTTADIVQIDYDGRLTSGETFDSSIKSGAPVTFPVAGVVPGFSEALQLMPKGAKYRVWIPPQIGYGPEAKRDPQTGKIVIPANAVLVFDITLHDFGPMPAGSMPGM
jgi:FKBP-type peptidyl-prolyl cis-trans isomerase